MTSWPVDPVTPLPWELGELTLSNSKPGQESDPLVDDTSEVLESEGMEVGVAG